MRYSIEPRDPSRRAVQKTEEATGDLIGNKIADKITSVSTELHSKKSSEELLSKTVMIIIMKLKYQKRCISPEERQQIIDELRLV